MFDVPIPKMAYGYIRVSDPKQLTKGGAAMPSGLSIAAQEDAIKHYFEYKLKPLGYEYGGCFRDEAVSAWNKQFRVRPAGYELNGRLNAGDYVIFAKVDRGFRNWRDLMSTIDGWKLREIGAVFLDLDIDVKTMPGQLMLMILGWMAEWESNRRSQRLIEVNQAKRARGQLTYRDAPLGFKPNGQKKPTPDPEERAIMAAILYLRNGGWTWDKIYWRLLKARVRWEDNYKHLKEWPKERIRLAAAAAKELDLEPRLDALLEAEEQVVLKKEKADDRKTAAPKPPKLPRAIKPTTPPRRSKAEQQ